MRKNGILIILTVLVLISVVLGFMYFVMPNIGTVNNSNNDVNHNYSDNNSNENYDEDETNFGDSNTILVNQTLNGTTSTLNLSSNAGSKKLTVGDLKEQFRLAGVDDSNKYMFKPFYNVEQNTEFTFHFNSKVDPVKAITVHTDEKCDYLSLVWQINGAYWTDDGIDVIVKPGSSVLYSKERSNVEKGVWGYAPIYYLCIRYDLDSKEVKKLDEPIIIPFTVKNEISTPTVYANIDEKGTFSIKWNKVDGATSYKVYSSLGSGVTELTIPETGYNVSPKLEATLKASEFEFNPGRLLLGKTVVGGEPKANNTISEKDSKYNIELVKYQNYNLYSYNAFYVTAVDALGNESNFGVPVMLNDYKTSLPDSVKGINRYTQLTSFPDTVEVEAIDHKTRYQYPINFYKIGETSEYLSYCDYRYEVVGTELTGIVSYKNEQKVFPNEHLSSYTPSSSAMPQNTMDRIPQVTVDTFADSDYSNSKVDLTKNPTYPANAKVELDAAKIYVLLDRDMARRVIGTPDVNATDPREEFDSFIVDDDPEYILRREGTTIIVEKVDKSNKPEEKPVEDKPTKVEPTEEPAEEVDNGNYVEEQKKSTEKQVEEADKEEVKGTKYPVFADNAAQMYLALAMINQEEAISLKAFPEYQNTNNLIDDLEYLWFQNPYIMGVDIWGGETRYDHKTQTLYLKYNVPTATAKKYQEAVYVKSQQVVNQIIKPGMTDAEKVVAIYEYLEENAEYNHEAINYSATGANDFYEKYSNSWNTYGILCEGLGVCQSYAYAFDLLAYLSGVESVMAVGTLQNGGHAWNAVKLDGKWYMVDATNNYKTSGIPYFVCNSSTDSIEEAAFKLNDRFVDGTNYSEFLVNDDKKDWYYKNDLMADSGAEIAKIWERETKTEDVIFIKCSVKTQAQLNQIMNDFISQAMKDGYTKNDLMNVYFGASAGYVIIQEK